MFISNEDQFELQRKALDALQRIKNQNHIYETKQDLIQPKLKNISYVLETYNQADFDKKMAHDITFYNILLSKLPSGNPEKSHIVDKIEEMFETVQSIYKEINVKPQIYGLPHYEGLTTLGSIEKESKRLIVEYINKNYYSLSLEEKDRKYKNKSLELAESLVYEQKIDIDESIVIAQKKIVLESFLRKVEFPIIAQGCIDEMITESQVDEFFDNTKIVNLYNNFNSQIDYISTVLASII